MILGTMSLGCTSNECITTLVRERRNGNNVFIASLTLFVYEYFLTIPLEIKHIWSSRLTIVNILYYTVKYGVLIECVMNGLQQTTDMSITHCRVAFWVRCYIYSVFTWAAEALVGISVWAVWQKDRRLTISMPLAFTAFCMVAFVYLGIWLDSFKLANPPSSLVHGCIVTSTSDTLNKPIIMVMIWITLTFVLITVSAIRSYKGGSNSTFIKMVYHRGMLYYFYLFGLHLTNLLLLYYGPSADLFQMITLPSRILQMAFTTRLVLHTRQQASKCVVLFSDSTNEEFRFGVSQLVS